MRIEKLKIYNSQGQVIKILQPLSSRFDINLDGVSSGMYYFGLTTAEGETIRRLVKH